MVFCVWYEYVIQIFLDMMFFYYIILVVRKYYYYLSYIIFLFNGISQYLILKY